MLNANIIYFLDTIIILGMQRRKIDGVVSTSIMCEEEMETKQMCGSRTKQRKPSSSEKDGS